MPKGYELVVIALLVLLLFGAKRLPDTARGLGRALRILKSETQGLRDDDQKTTATSSGATTSTGTAGVSTVGTPDQAHAAQQPPLALPTTTAPTTTAPSVTDDVSGRVTPGDTSPR